MELAHRPPERRQRRLLAGVVPDGRGYHPATARDSSHLGEAANGIRHEVHDELSER